MHTTLTVTFMLCALALSELVSSREPTLLELLSMLQNTLTDEETTTVAPDDDVTTPAPTATSPEEARLLHTYGYLWLFTRFDALKRVQLKMALIRSYVEQETSVDAILNGLDTKLNVDFEDVKEKVAAKSQSMNQHVDSELHGVDSTLTSVNTFVRSRNKEVAGAIYHGGMGSACPAGSADCHLADTGCYDDSCQCDPGLSYDALHQRCSASCRNYGNTFQATPNIILRGFNMVAVNETSMEDCKTACLEAEDFVCTAIEYFPRWSECYLAGDLSTEDTDDSWEYNPAGGHYQRDCAYY